MTEEINEIACKHCNEVMCSVCENKTCDDTHLATLKCEYWRCRRAGFYCGYEQVEKKLKQENNKLLDVINEQDVKIADLEKQLKKEMNDYKMIDNCNRIHENELEQAKELLKQYVELGNPLWDEDFLKLESLNEQSEQFLKE